MILTAMYRISYLSLGVKENVYIVELEKCKNKFCDSEIYVKNNEIHYFINFLY